MSDFTDIVSLGYRCRLAERLRKHYGFDQAFPFDWWITPLRGGGDFLREWDAGVLYEPDLLVEEAGRHGEIAFIRNERYSIKLQHEFPRVGGVAIAPGWREHLAQARARTEHLMARFDALDRTGRRILFVRELTAGEVGRPRPLARLREAVLQRVPRAQASFLAITPEPAALDGWDVLPIDDPKPNPWQGDAAVWDAAFASLGHRRVPLQET
jgi:hypothetical protein